MSQPYSLEQSDRRALRRELLLVCGFALALFMVLNVHLGRLQFTNAGETAVMEAALEARRDGNWWIPTLLGVQRLIKPPLTTWIAASAIPDGTLSELSSLSQEKRDLAYEQLASESRRPFVFSSALTVLAIYGLGRIIAGGTVGVISAVVAGTSLLFLRHGRIATTDVQLTLWVNVANFFMALALLRGRRWIGAAGAGVALGLSIMSKGPVGLAQSIVPFAIFWGCSRWFGPTPPSAVAARRAIGPTLVGIALFLLIAAPWPVSVYLLKNDIIASWTREITRVGATPNKPDAWYNYIIFVPNMLPWAPLLIAGLCAPFLKRFRGSNLMLPWLLLMVPIVIMSLAPDINIRYATPMVGAASVLCGAMAVEMTKPWSRLTWSDKLLAAAQWFFATVMALAILAGGFAGTAANGASWYSMPLAITGTTLACAAMLVAWLIRSRFGYSWILSSAIVSVLAYMLFMVGYVKSPGGMAAYKPVADAVWKAYPGAEAYYYDPRPQTRHVPTDLAIYLNRIVRHIEDPNQLVPSARPQLVFMLQRQGEPKPQLPQWREAMAISVGRQTCFAFVRE